MNKKTLFRRIVTHSLAVGVVIGMARYLPIEYHFFSRVRALSTPFALSVNPPVNYIWINPGENKTIPISVQNQGTQKVTISTKLVEFRPDAASGRPILDLEKPATIPYLNSAQTNLTFELDPSAKQVINLPLEVPTTASEQEYHLSLLVSAQPMQTTPETTGAQVSGIVASNLIITVSPTDTNRGQLQLTQYLGQSTLDSLQPLRFQLLAENNGPHAIAASGSAVIRDWTGKPVAEFSFYPDIVLSHGRRLLRTSQTTMTNPEVASADLTDIFSYDPLVLFGPYQVDIQLWGMNEQAQNPVLITKQVVALPFSGFVVVGVMVCCWVFYLVVINKHLQRRSQTNQTA